MNSGNVNEHVNTSDVTTESGLGTGYETGRGYGMVPRKSPNDTQNPNQSPVTVTGIWDGSMHIYGGNPKRRGGLGKENSSPFTGCIRYV